VEKILNNYMTHPERHASAVGFYLIGADGKEFAT
jgi:hypothetical protein